MELFQNCFHHIEFKTDEKTNNENKHSLSDNPVEFSQEVYENWINVDSHFNVAEVPT